MFKKAVKSQRKLKLAIYGASGSGKTYSALAIATGLGSKIGLIDSERSSASLYSDEFKFETCNLEQPNVDSYVKAIDGAGAAGFDVLIIDSLSHGWQQLLEEVEKLAKAKYQGNTWSAWSEGTPTQRKLLNAIINFDGHVIATMRAKTEWDTEKTSSGKSRPVRIGLAPEQGKGIEYEFDFLLSITPEHFAHFDKSRSRLFADKIYKKPDESLGKELLAWLQDGVELATSEQLKEVRALKDDGFLPIATLKAWLTSNNVEKLSDIPADVMGGYLKEIAFIQSKFDKATQENTSELEVNLDREPS